MQKMHGPSDVYCPLWRKPMSKVCHTCAWWTEIPIIKENIASSVWACAQSASIVYTRDAVAAARGNQAATESMRNEMVKMHIEGTNAISHAITTSTRQAIDVTPQPKRLGFEQ